MTTNEDLRSRLDAAVKRREDLAQKRQRLLGRLEEAERTLDDLRTKCRSRGIDPDTLDSVVSGLSDSLAQSLTALELKLAEAEQALEPFNNRK